MSAILKLCVIFLLIYGTDGQTARCDYKHQYHWSTGYKTTNASYYKCDLSTRQANYDEKLTRIYGQHLTGHSDGDVKYIVNYKNNKLKTFSSIFCQKFPNLEAIDMSDAEVESIDENSLSNCKNLDHLMLNGNKIRELPENLLIENSILTLFLIRNNQLTTLPENLFLNQKKLEYLELQSNQINFLPSNIFRPLKKLEVLVLHYNKLQSINPCFVTLHNLKWLSLHGNQISEIPLKCFASFGKLERLWLHENGIKTLKSDSFDGLQELQVLNLHSNEISDLPVGVFTQLKNLQQLSLRNNKLTTIHSDSFSIHNQLTKIWLDDNKISAIDSKFIDSTAVIYLNMTNNICSQSLLKSRANIKNNLRKCFANYQQGPIQVTSLCGQSVMPQGNIIGGAQIKRNSYPWIAALLRPTDGQFFCGGILVSNRKIVTAAHCIQEKGENSPLLPRSVIVLLGFHDLSNSIEIGRIPFAVQTIQIHPDWNPYTSSYDADIAVLMLEQDVVFNQQIQPICMTSADSRIAALTEGFVVGNGKGGQENEYENIPKILKMPIQTSRHCTEKDSTFQGLLTGRTFCAGSGTGQGVCTGDSGSGFVVQIGGIFYLRGIVSASLPNYYLGCNVDTYSVFTDVLKFIRWINEL